MKKTILTSLITLSLAICALTGCGNADAANTQTAQAEAPASDTQQTADTQEINEPDIPFTELSFLSTLDDVVKTEGDKYETYDSIYNGTTYTYDKTYMDKSGTIKYMFDDKEELVNIAWTCSFIDDDATIAAYNDALSTIEKDFGAPTKNVDGFMNYAETWKLANCNIVVSAVTTSDAKMIQIAFLSPKVAK